MGQEKQRRTREDDGGGEAACRVPCRVRRAKKRRALEEMDGDVPLDEGPHQDTGSPHPKWHLQLAGWLIDSPSMAERFIRGGDDGDMHALRGESRREVVDHRS